ncbi:hypothetical protein D3C80_2074650 [compost metagenome]
MEFNVLELAVFIIAGAVGHVEVVPFFVHVQAKLAISAGMISVTTASSTFIVLLFHARMV